MAYSYFDYKGTDTTIQTDISCVSTEHMYAFEVLSEDNSNVTLGDVALAATFTKTNAGVLCELNTAPSKKIRIIRSTPYNVLMHDFSNGAQFNADSVDEVYEQLLYLCQEIVEGKLVIDSSGIKTDYISKAELQAQLAAQYSLGYNIGYNAGEATGKVTGYNTGYNAGETVGYNAGYNAGKADGYNAGKADGYNAGYNAGKADGSGGSQGGQMTDAQGRPVYTLAVTFIEYGIDKQGNSTGDDITSQSTAYSYSVVNNEVSYGNRDYLSEQTITIYGGSHIVGGAIPYTFKGQYNKHVRVELRVVR